ncbi:hypothetical protein Tco_0550543, partial [Tanacetum coccineum]
MRRTIHVPKRDTLGLLPLLKPWVSQQAAVTVAAIWAVKNTTIPLIVTTSRYVVPTGRVKVPAGRYVVPTGKDNVIVSTGKSKVIPAG